jgi:hypothetical protein
VRARQPSIPPPPHILALSAPSPVVPDPPAVFLSLQISEGLPAPRDGRGAPLAAPRPPEAFFISSSSFTAASTGCPHPYWPASARAAAGADGAADSDPDKRPRSARAAARAADEADSEWVGWGDSD